MLVEGSKGTPEKSGRVSPCDGATAVPGGRRASFKQIRLTPG